MELESFKILTHDLFTNVPKDKSIQGPPL